MKHVPSTFLLGRLCKTSLRQGYAYFGGRSFPPESHKFKQRTEGLESPSLLIKLQLSQAAQPCAHFCMKKPTFLHLHEGPVQRRITD